MDIKNIALLMLDLHHVTINSSFYAQLLEYWYTLYSREPSHSVGIVSCSLWNNKHICIDKKPVWYKYWSEHGINVFNHILGEGGNILSKEQLENKYDITISQMNYNSLVHAIPASWKILAKNTCRYSVLPTMNTKLYINNILKDISVLYCKDFYWEFISLVSSTPRCEEKWSKYVDTSNMNWQDIYVIPYNVCRETYIQSFQYKILHRIHPCNYTFSIWYKDKSSLCSNCNETDYLEHYFFNCKQVMHLWNSIEKWWKNVLEVTFKLDVSSVLFGIPQISDDDVIDVMNFCILYAKHYLHLKKLSGEHFFFIDYLKYIKDKLEIEKMVCALKGDKFADKWANLYEML